MNGKLWHRPCSVFINGKTGRPGLVISYFDEIKPISISARLDNGESRSHYQLVDEPGWHALSGEVSIPPTSAAVLFD